MNGHATNGCRRPVVLQPITVEVMPNEVADHDLGDTDVVTRVRGANRLASRTAIGIHRLAFGSCNVLVLPWHCDTGCRIRPGLQRIEETVAVVSSNEYRGDTGIAVHERDGVERKLSDVGDLIRPGDCFPFDDRRTWRIVCVGAVGGLLDLNPSDCCDIVRSVLILDRLQLERFALVVDRRPDSRSHVGVDVSVSGIDGRAGGGTGHRFVRIELGGRTRGRAKLVVRHRDAGQRDVARVGHDIGPHDIGADRDAWHVRTVRQIGVRPVRRLLEVDVG